eukprot:7380743-Prymnesium_polylepis.1
MLRIAFYARQPHQVYVRGLPAGMIVREDAPLTKLEGVTISLQKKTLTVVTEKWRMSAESTIAYPHANQLRMNIQITSLYRVCSDMIAPQGILGQTYDCDGRPLHGRRDSYEWLDSGLATRSRRSMGGVVTTRAQAEGAVVGTVDNYLVAS